MTATARSGLVVLPPRAVVLVDVADAVVAEVLRAGGSSANVIGMVAAMCL